MRDMDWIGSRETSKRVNGLVRDFSKM